MEIRYYIALILVIIIFSITNVGCLDIKDSEYDYHLYISNQCTNKVLANITITVGNEVVYSEQTWSDDGHNYTIIDKKTSAGKIKIYAQESDTSTVVMKEINIDREKWIWINFTFFVEEDEFSFTIDVFNEKHGIS